ncbi:MAG TPA: protein kinase [Gemmatimonadales bacterium]
MTGSGGGGPEPIDRDTMEVLFERARAMQPEARAAFLAEACRGDRRIQRELDSLLAHAAEAEGFFARLAGSLVSPTVGHSMGHYRILGALGSGGMGTVYRAHDTRLDREVALKFLPPHLSAQPEARERLLVEARAAAALEHPNVCTIHEIGETADGRPFLAMACYAGETLSQRLGRGVVPPGEAVAIAVQVARGLAAAHARGIVHRDVKPGNIMLCADGTVRLLDFGLAKLQDVTLTSPGARPGTIAYMSPEQARGDPLDRRTDLWSLGVVLYEMLTGVRPFRGGNDQAVILAILHEQPPSLARARPEVSERLAQTVRRLLRKDPAERYGSAVDLLADLASTGGETAAIPPRSTSRIRGGILLAALAALIAVAWSLAQRHAGDAREVRRLAVLPLANLTGDPRREYFVDGLHDALISEMSRIPGLVVISRQSMMRYRGSTEPVPLIARALGVDALLEGSVFLAGDSVRITVQLVRAEPEEHLWAGSYHRGLENALALQGEVARAVARAIHARTTSDTASGATPLLVSREAQDAYLKGLFYQERLIQASDGSGARATIRTAAGWLEKAVALAPDWAAAHARLARAYHWLASYMQDPRLADEYYPKSKAAALRALELDESEAQAHASLGFVLFNHERDWTGAERSIRRALELDPNSHQWIYALYLLAAGRTGEAVEHFRQAQTRNPLSAIISQQLAWAYACDGRADEAIRELTELRARLDDTPGWLRSNLATYYLEGSKYPEAIAQLETLAVMVDSDAQSLAELASAYADAGRKDAARRLLARIVARDGSWYAPELYLALGDTGRAIATVEDALETNPNAFLHFRCSTIHRKLSAEPRIRDIVRRLRYPS